MIIIFGGAYQGKLDYAKEQYGVRQEEIWTVESGVPVIEHDKKVIYGLEKWIMHLVKEEVAVDKWLAQQLPLWEDKIIICEEVSCGVVPIDATLRKWREEVGRSMTQLGKNAEQVVRVFCGIGTILK